MSSSTVIVMNVFGILLILVAAMTLIPWRKIGEKIFANNPTKAVIYIEYGEETEAVHGSYSYSNEKGAFYTYIWRKRELIVSVPDDYGYKWLHGRRCIRIANPGDAWASYWNKEKMPKTIQKSAFDLNALIKGKVGVELVKTIYGVKKFSAWAVIILIAGALLIGYYLYSQNKPDNGNIPEIPTTQQNTAPANIDNVPYSK